MGSAPSTHVANKSGHDIYARVATERAHATSIGLNFGASGEIEGVSASKEGGITQEKEWNEFIKDGYMRILDGKYFRFSYKKKNNPFVTILSTYKEHNVVAYNIRVKKGQNVYVGPNGMMHNAKKGKIWE